LLEHGIIVITSSENAAGILVISIRNKTVTMGIVLDIVYNDKLNRTPKFAKRFTDVLTQV
jgi:hypothetical protein